MTAADNCLAKPGIREGLWNHKYEERHTWIGLGGSNECSQTVGQVWKNVIFSVWCLRGLLGSCLYSWPKIKLNVSLSLWCYCSTSNHFTVVLSFISSVDSTPSISIVNPIVADNSGARLMTNCWQESRAVQGGVQDNISKDESGQFFHWPHSITISLSVDDEKVTCKRGKNKITLTTDWSQENTQQPKNQTYSIVWEHLTSVALQ